MAQFKQAVVLMVGVSDTWVHAGMVETRARFRPIVTLWFWNLLSVSAVYVACMCGMPTGLKLWLEGFVCLLDPLTLNSEGNIQGAD